jgi:GNAT superfamily N-acetyltransferase
MMKALPDIRKIIFLPVNKYRWKDFEQLFGERGACGGCWCMAWRLKSSAFKKQKGDKNKRAMKRIVYDNEIPGIIAYFENKPIGWCAFAPREKFIRLNDSRVLAPIDDEKVWSVTCFFIHKNFRRMGISTELLKAVIKYCKKKRVKILEAYPQEPYSDNIPAAFVWTGIPAAFERAGFKVVERRSPKRPIMRYYL